MGKLIAAINMTLDGFCDHTAGIADDELHQHYAELLSHADLIVYGRITYQLMEYWRTVVEKPTGNPAQDDFAIIMDKVPKLVFSGTLKTVGWESARLANREFAEELSALKKGPDKNILIGSPSLIITALNLDLIDEFQLCVHPVLEANGSPLFKAISDRILLKLLKTKNLGSGAIVLYYEPTKNNG